MGTIASRMAAVAGPAVAQAAGEVADKTCGSPCVLLSKNVPELIQCPRCRRPIACQWGVILTEGYLTDLIADGRRPTNA
jgi:hypothetical protein